LILCVVVELLLIDVVRKVFDVPGNGPAKALFTTYPFGIPQIRPDACRIEIA
jgi:hypothetical protein